MHRVETTLNTVLFCACTCSVRDCAIGSACMFVLPMCDTHQLLPLNSCIALQTELSSFLIEITALIFKKKDEDEKSYILDSILDKTGMKGTGTDMFMLTYIGGPHDLIMSFNLQSSIALLKIVTYLDGTCRGIF